MLSQNKQKLSYFFAVCLFKTAIYKLILWDPTLGYNSFALHFFPVFLATVKTRKDENRN